MERTITVSELWYYPVKSCRGIPLRKAYVARRGIQYDREWMIVDGNGAMVTQRTHPRLCQIETSIEEHVLVLSAAGIRPVTVPLYGMESKQLTVEVWRNTCDAIDQGPDVAHWLSFFLGHALSNGYRLVRFKPSQIRTAPIGPSELSFADAYPFLVISQASLDDLNSRLAEPLPMNRFRPNIVITGMEPYGEDRWTVIRIGKVGFQGMKRCERCTTTTTDQQTGERGKEPLRTLATYRRVGDGIIFGKNFNHLDTGMIAVGDAIDVLIRD